MPSLGPLVPLVPSSVTWGLHPETTRPTAKPLRCLEAGAARSLHFTRGPDPWTSPGWGGGAGTGGTGRKGGSACGEGEQRLLQKQRT
jgi:hypothetical protein